MIYCPNRFVFIHIPRTGGTSVTAALASACVARMDSVVSTTYLPNNAGWNKHATAREMRTVIPDWDKIVKVATYRPTADIIESDYRLHQRGYRNWQRGAYNQTWTESVKKSATETLEQFANRRWKPWLAGEEAWDHWTRGCGDKLIRMAFDDLAADFSEVLRILELPVAELGHLNGVKKCLWWDVPAEKKPASNPLPAGEETR